MRRPVTVISILGSKLDAGWRADRWKSWRPTVSLFQHDDLLVDRMILLVNQHDSQLADVVMQDIASVSPETRIERLSLRATDPWDFEQVFAELHEVAGELSLNGETEDVLVNVTTGTHVAQICLFLLTESRHFPGRLLQVEPPRKDRSPGSYSIIDLNLDRYDRLASRFREEQQAAADVLKSGIPTRNARFNRMMERLEQIALRSTEPILLLGPTGAGKTRLARQIHELKRSRNHIVGPLIDVNCATLRGDQAASTLFGHVRGAFTGANTSRDGLLRLANNGMLFLDEIGELGLDEQAMLLRAIEEGVFYPMGSDKPVRTQFMLIAGTNRDLRQQVQLGRFREDLLARIDLWTFTLPGLRDRPEDLEPNLDFELTRFSARTGQRVTINSAARQRWLDFATSPDALWIGNFRDLHASVVRMATLATSGRITVDDVSEEIDRLQSNWRGNARTTSIADARETQTKNAIRQLPDGLPSPNSFNDTPENNYPEYSSPTTLAHPSALPFQGGGTPQPTTPNHDLVTRILGPESAAALDRFDRVQLEDVLRVCATSPTISHAGRTLFAQSMAQRHTRNDADRLRKYLARFELRFEGLFKTGEDA